MGIAKAIQGSNVHVYAKIGDEYFEIVCGTDVLYEKTQELIGATTIDSGTWAEVRPRIKRWRCTILGATTTENDSNISAFYLNQDSQFSSVVDLKITFEGDDASLVIITGNAYIERTSFNGPVEGMSQYEINLIGSGGATETVIDDPASAGENVGSITLVVTGGAVQDNVLIGAGIIGVWVEGSNLESTGISYVHNSGTGTITPDSNFTIDGQRLFVIYTY